MKKELKNNKEALTDCFICNDCNKFVPTVTLIMGKKKIMHKRQVHALCKDCLINFLLLERDE